MSEAMHVYVDTEFTDFIDCDLISIAAVAAEGREFYGERDDCDDMNCSVFVREAVLPKLGEFQDRVFTRDALRLELLAWLGLFPGGAVLRRRARLGSSARSPRGTAARLGSPTDQRAAGPGAGGGVLPQARRPAPRVARSPCRPLRNE
jgi:hypothetical protein